MADKNLYNTKLNTRQLTYMPLAEVWISAISLEIIFVYLPKVKMNICFDSEILSLEFYTIHRHTFRRMWRYCNVYLLQHCLWYKDQERATTVIRRRLLKWSMVESYTVSLTIQPLKEYGWFLSTDTGRYSR